MPGVVVTTGTRTGPTGAGEAVASQTFFAGPAERGPAEATLVRSVEQYRFYYGDYESGNLYPHIVTFFEEGGARAYVKRALANDATSGTLTLVDGSALDTLTIDAKNGGVWSDNLEIEVIAGVVANTFKIRVYLKGVLIWTSRDLINPADAETVINTSPVNHLISATDEGSVTVAPDNNPDVLAITPLAGGANGSSLVDADYTTALDSFTYELGPGAVAIPGQTGTTIWDALILHARGNNRIALLGFDPDDDMDAAIAAVPAYYSDENAQYAGFYFPHVLVPDPASAGLTLTISPEAFVAAKRSKAVNNTGTWRAGAGLISEARYVSDLAAVVDKADGDTLDEKRINAIRKIGKGIRVYGARSADEDEANWRYLTMQDTINYIVWECEQRLENFVFETIDSRGTLFSRIKAALVGLLDPIRISGGLYEAFDTDGGMVDPGYSVTVDDTVNPLVNLASGLVTALVGVRVSSVGDKIEVTVTKSNLTASVL